jgi:hypothetical protein
MIKVSIGLCLFVGFGVTAVGCGEGGGGAVSDGGFALQGTRLVIADPDQDRLYVYAMPELQLVSTLDGLRVDTHAGFLALDDGRVLFVNAAPPGELVALDPGGAEARIVGRAPVELPVAHIAVDPGQTYAAASHGDGAGGGVFSLVRLSDFTHKQVAMPTGEPGVALGGDPLRLYHRNDNPPQVEAYLWSALWDGTVPTPTVGMIGDAPHGEVIAHSANKLVVAADDGMNVLTLVDGVPGAKTVVPYDVDGRQGGRAFYARLSADGRYAYSYLRNAGPDGMAPWGEWESDAYVLDIENETARRIAIGKGLVYRLADSPKFALFVQYHPEGDFAHVMDTDVASPSFQSIMAKIPLDTMSKAPGADGSPWESSAFRVAAMDPRGKWGFVSHGGDGLISVIDLTAKTVVTKLATPTKLNGGGYLVAVERGTRTVDTIGR